MNNGIWNKERGPQGELGPVGPTGPAGPVFDGTTPLSELTVNGISNLNGITTISDDLKLTGGFLSFNSGGKSAFVDVSQPSIYRSSTNTGSAPFDQIGNLVYEGRGDASGRGHYFITGGTGPQAVELYILEGESTFNGALSIEGTVTMSGLPTSDPVSAGVLWNSSGTVMISAG